MTIVCICTETVWHVGCPVAGHGWAASREAVADAESSADAAWEVVEQWKEMVRQSGNYRQSDEYATEVAQIAVNVKLRAERAEAVVVAARNLCERVLGTTVDTGDVLVSPLDVDDLRSAIAAWSAS